jgi:dienelactone hydrolase
MRICFLFSLALLLLGSGFYQPLFAATVAEAVPYTVGTVKCSGFLVYDQASTSKRPALLMVPNWLGPTEANLAMAKTIAEMGYVVFMADMYGVDVRPKNSDEAGNAVKPFYADRQMMRTRVAAALGVLLQQGNKAPIDAQKIGAIGFCFGGCSVLEFARSGNDTIRGVVSFHGNLNTPQPDDAKNIKAHVLVVHGANDPFVPQTEVQDFIRTMQATKADWQLVQLSNSVHSFTDPTANWPGKAEYNAVSAKRAFRLMQNFFQELF